MPLCAAAPVACRAPAQPSTRRAALRRCPRAALRPARAHAGAGAQPGDAASLASFAAAAPPAPPKSTSPAVKEHTSLQPQPAVERVDWRRSWYAVAALDALEPDVPTAVTVMGQRIALWRDAEGIWRALRDECPHRLAPLSEGRVAEDGTLQCSYHGWRFGGCGACAGVPQDPRVAGAAAMRSPRSAAASFPTRQAQGLLWLYPDAGPGALEASMRAPLPLIPGLDGEPGPAVAESGLPHVRDFPYGMDTLLENLTDPAHVSWSHHGVTGNRSTLPAVPMRVVAPPSARGYEAATPADPGKHPAQTHSFFAPSLLKIKQDSAAGSGGSSERGHGAAGGLYLYTTPLEPGVTRVISRHVSTAPAGGGVLAGVAAALRRALRPLTVVPLHLFLNEAFDGDLVFLHSQERALRASRPAAVDGLSATPWRSAYFLATAEDAGVIACRRWFDEHGGGGPFGDAPLPPRERNRRVLLDRWGQHAVHCAHCRAAGERAQAAARGLSVAGGVAAAAAVAALLAAGGEATPAALTVAAAAPAFGAAAQAANALDAGLRFKDYVHGKR